MRKLINEYNKYADIPTEQQKNRLDFNKIKQSSNNFNIDKLPKRSIINTYNLMLRAQEEMEYSKSKMYAVVRFYEKQIHFIHSKIPELDNSEKAYYRCHVVKLEIELCRLTKLLSNFISREVSTPLLKEGALDILDLCFPSSLIDTECDTDSDEDDDESLYEIDAEILHV